MHCEQLQDVEVAGHIFESFIKSHTKGQIILKRLLLSLDSSKLRTNEFRFFCRTVLKTNLFICFLEESEDTKKSFRNYLTFSTIYVDTCIDHPGQIPSLECQASIRLKMSSEKNETTRVYALKLDYSFKLLFR